MKNAVNWFEIPASELDRAVKFYESIFAAKLHRERFAGIDMAIFEGDKDGVRGAVILDARRKPAMDGTLIYLNANGQLERVLARVKDAGGSVLMGKTAIGDPGFIALIRDTEGNQIGLHSEKT